MSTPKRTYTFIASADPLKNTDTPARYEREVGYPADLTPIDWCMGTVEAYEFRHASGQVHQILLARKASGLAPRGTIYDITIR